MLYRVYHLLAATAAASNLASGQLWNASGLPVYLKELWLFKRTSGGNEFGRICFTSARGTQTTSEAVNSSHCMGLPKVAPPGSINIDGDFSAEPTQDPDWVGAYALPDAIGASVILVWPDPIIIPSGSGLAVVSNANANANYESTWVFEV